MRITGLLGLVACALVAQNTQPNFENDQVVVNEPHPNVKVDWTTHPSHEHKYNRVMVYMHLGGEYLHYPGGRTVDLKWHPGEVLWSPADGSHYSEGKPDTPPFKGPMIVDIGVKKAGDPSKKVSATMDLAKLDPKHVKVELENAQVRVLRLKLGPKESLPMHEDTLNHLVVFITDANVRDTAADGKAQTATHKSAETLWGGATKHKVENLSDQPFEAVVVEFKS